MSLVRFRPEAPAALRPLCGFSSFGRARPCQGRGGGFEPRNPLQNRTRKSFVSDFSSRRHSQAVRQRSAKPLFPSSILGGASRNTKSIPNGMLFVFLEMKRTCRCMKNEARLRLMKCAYRHMKSLKCASLHVCTANTSCKA